MRIVGAIEPRKWRGEFLVKDIGTGDIRVVRLGVEFAAIDVIFGDCDRIAGGGLRDGLPA